MRVTDTGQGGTLARTHEGKPGLPRGRSRLPLPAVRASQRERLLRSVIAAVSESGYLAVTVADIVRRARVSRAAFYAHFADKEDCFLAATAEGRDLMIAQVVSATRALHAEACDEEVLRVACRAYLAFLAGEPAFARVFYIHMPTAGPRAVDRLEVGTGLFPDLEPEMAPACATASPGMAVRPFRGVSRPRRCHGRTGAIHGPRGLD